MLWLGPMQGSCALIGQLSWGVYEKYLALSTTCSIHLHCMGSMPYFAGKLTACCWQRQSWAPWLVLPQPEHSWLWPCPEQLWGHWKSQHRTQLLLLTTSLASHACSGLDLSCPRGMTGCRQVSQGGPCACQGTWGRPTLLCYYERGTQAAACCPDSSCAE